MFTLDVQAENKTFEHHLFTVSTTPNKAKDKEFQEKHHALSEFRSQGNINQESKTYNWSYK